MNKFKPNAEAAQQKQQEALQLLEQGIKALSESGNWEDYLKVQSRFHRYSFRNVVMILSQCPDATRIAGYRAWQEMGRQVRKGEKAIAILAPIIRKVEDVTTGEDVRRLTGFKGSAVFDISQTEGDELPQLSTALNGDDAGLLDKLLEFAASRNIPVSFKGFSNWKLGDKSAIRNNEFVSLQNQELRQLALQPVIGAIAARLARTSQIRLLDDQLVYKPPQDKDNASVVGWHADRAYWATCTSDRLLTAWIPLHDCDEAHGSLVVMDGSHLWPGLEHLRHFNQTNLAELEHQLAQAGRSVIKVPMALKKGQVSFHNCWTIHGSYPNRSPERRLALAVHLQDLDNHYRGFKNAKGQEIHIFDEQLCRKLPDGDPDFSDPDIFPVLWQAQSEAS